MANILIVEDDADLVETYADLLTAREHEVACASRIEDALDKLLAVAPQIILLDLHLPGAKMSTLENLVQKAKQSCEAKVLIVSGHPEMMCDAGLLENVDLILTKPVSNAHLLTMIDRMLPQRDNVALPGQPGVEGESPA